MQCRCAARVLRHPIVKSLLVLRPSCGRAYYGPGIGGWTGAFIDVWQRGVNLEQLLQEGNISQDVRRY